MSRVVPTVSQVSATIRRRSLFVPGDRVRALSWLSRLEEDHAEAVDALVAVVSSDAPIDVRVQAIRTLSRMKDSDVERTLNRLAQAGSDHPAIAIAAARALASRGMERS